MRPPVSTRGLTSGSQDANSPTQTPSSVPLCFVSFAQFVLLCSSRPEPCASFQVTCCLTTHQTEPMKLINRSTDRDSPVLHCPPNVGGRAPPEVQLETSPWSNMLAWKRLPASSPLTGNASRPSFRDTSSRGDEPRQGVSAMCTDSLFCAPFKLSSFPSALIANYRPHSS